MHMPSQSVLITGGTGGIGLALAEEFSARGAAVAVCGRDEKKLASVREQHPTWQVVRCDVTKAEDRTVLLATAQKLARPLTILVNNAGIMPDDDLSRGNADVARLRETVETNFFAPLELTNMFLPFLSRQKEAAIVNISSGLIDVTFAGTPIYCAAKSALHAYSVALRHQLRQTSVKIFEVIPPAVDTDLVRRYEFPKARPAEVAKKAADAIEAGREEIRIGMAKSLYALSRLAPKAMFRLLNKTASH